MLVILDKKNGEASEQFMELIGSLPDGRFVVQIRELGGKTLKDYREHYFAMIDVIGSHTGDGRYSTHELFKAHEEVSTTKDFSVDDWLKFIESLKWWAFNNLDLIV